MYKSLKHNSPKFFFILILIFFLSLTYISMKSTENLVEEQNDSKFNTTGAWGLPATIIDDTGGGDYTWEEAILQPWCDGSGTLIVI